LGSDQCRCYDVPGKNQLIFNSMKTRFILMMLLLVFLTGAKIHSCTIFYTASGDRVFAGNNEDWSDPNTKMWFYPAVGNKHGWVKFGFGNGFPQGGMNDQGLFWDGSSNPYLAMPYSEANKVKLDSPIMQKVITECANVDEALEIFQQYYYDDQYKAQYLIGDASGKSLIVEGDNILVIDSSYQVLTNFYHSHPEMGGYPCWRHETTCQMLSGSNELSAYLIGSILDATHQEGKYPTQYSNIYNLKNNIFYLFHYHNYEEFIEIDLAEQLKKGIKSFDIPGLFSKVTLTAPADGAELESTTVTFTWKGIPDSVYELMCSADPEFHNVVHSSHYKNKRTEVVGKAGMFYVFPILLLLIFAWIKGKRTVSFFLVVFGLILIMPQCKKEEPPSPEVELVEMNETLNNLSPGTVYYWKIKAHPSNQADFMSETRVRSFQTTN